MQDDLIDAYFVCIKKKCLVERVAQKSMHVTNAYVILFLASAKSGGTGILYKL